MCLIEVLDGNRIPTPVTRPEPTIHHHSTGTLSLLRPAHRVGVAYVAVSLNLLGDPPILHRPAGSQPPWLVLHPAIQSARRAR